MQKSTYTNFEVIVVDHGSTDNTKSELQLEFPEVIRVIGSEKLWWSGATNLGIKEALKRGADAVMLLNNDCFLEPDTIEKLVNRLKQIKGEAIIAPVQCDASTGKVLVITARTALLIGFPTFLATRNISAAKKKAHNGLVETKLIAGGRGVLIPASIFKRIGLLDDESLPHYYADHDFYIRCRKSGIPLFIATDTKVFIDQEKTSLAQSPGILTFRQFLETFKNRRSHRDIQQLSPLFKKHYPIPGCYFIGLGLNILRYVISYLIHRGIYLIQAESFSKTNHKSI
ncbi:MAG: hypothetical protein AVO38_10000 [delta proteobacterium ML8_D]|nr:MAG: hypothetical protein AVO38_10000 [delta proteobacterium ML8_D]